MSKSASTQPLIVRIFAHLLCLYPHPFREMYAHEMLLVFRDQLRAAACNHGRWGIATVCVHALCDLGLTIAAERWSTFKGGMPMLRRGLDIILSLWMLWLGLPFLLPIALLIKLDSPGPVFYIAPRIGKNGQQFMLLKLRTRTNVGVERRETRMGRVLGWTRLEEYPQFYNVLCGNMSLFGPRPQYPEVAEACHLVVRPGLVPWFNR